MSRLSRPARLRPARLAAPALLLAAVGCAQPGPFVQRNALVGSLRESVAQLESDKQRLERQVAELTSENNRLEDDLVQEELHSRELTARLEDARRFARGGDALDAETERSGSSPRTVPAARPKGRRNPFAQIPGDIQPLPETESGARRDDPFGASSRPGRRTTPAEDEPDSDLFPSRDDRHSRLDVSQGRWLPMARRSVAREIR
jgi:hypothetical protein